MGFREWEGLFFSVALPPCFLGVFLQRSFGFILRFLPPTPPHSATLYFTPGSMHLRPSAFPNCTYVVCSNLCPLLPEQMGSGWGAEGTPGPSCSTVPRPQHTPLITVYYKLILVSDGRERSCGASWSPASVPGSCPKARSGAAKR